MERCIVRDASEQGLRVDDGTVLISATQILTVHQGIEVIKGRMLATGVHVAHVDESGLLIRRHSTVTFTHSTISSCAGSGVWTIGGTLWLLDNSIYNTAQHGIYAQDYHDVLVLSGNVVAFILKTAQLLLFGAMQSMQSMAMASTHKLPSLLSHTTA